MGETGTVIASNTHEVRHSGGGHGAAGLETLAEGSGSSGLGNRSLGNM